MFKNAFSKNIKMSIYLSCYGLLLASPVSATGQARTLNQSLTASPPRNVCNFDIKSAPSNPVWQHAFNDIRRRKTIYEDCFAKEPFSHWHWSWKVGWLKRCASMDDLSCERLLKQGIEDRASLARRYAAQEMGSRYEGTNNPRALAMLERALKQQSFENKTAIIQDEDNKRLIFAIFRIGGKPALKAALKSLNLSETQQKYVERLNSQP